MARGTVIFDECGFLDEDLIVTYGAFAIVNKSFKTGKDRDGKSIDSIRLRMFPESLPYQKIYISSASSTDTEFYRLYKEFSKKMFIGDPDYFVLHADCEMVFAPTKHGELVSPLLSRSTVETSMRTNPEKARREYYCEFTSDAGAEAIIKRGTITRNSETRAPLLYNDTNKKKFVITYDPARSRDNSVIVVMEVYEDDKTGTYKGRIVNCVNLLDVGKKRKSPMQTPEQIKYLKELIVDYNGDAPDYENILAVMIDAGSGGAGVNIADFLMEDWVDQKGITHRGLIDKKYSEEYAKKYPNAVDKLKLMQPHNYKSEFYESLIEMMNQDCMSFTADYDHKGYLSVFATDEKLFAKAKREIEEKLKKEHLDEVTYKERFEEELKGASCIKTKMVKLDFYQELALSNIDAAKEEIINMVRKKRDTGRDSFELTPEKANKLHDDRAYCIAMCAYFLAQKRIESVHKKTTRLESNVIDFFKIRTPEKGKSYFG